jgi:hypothetical protein
MPTCRGRQVTPRYSKRLHPHLAMADPTNHSLENEPRAFH